MDKFRDREWQYDINSFGRWQRIRSTLTSDNAKAKCTEHMSEIQKRWPQFIKAPEVSA